MSVRTYIGARYVPRFLGVYDPTQSYEGLDVVDNGSGTSYISRKTTPAGTPLTDTDHWALYGAASGAIINLQNQIDAIDARVVALEPLKGGYATPEYYGAVGDGVTDDIAAIQAAVDANANVLFTKEYYISAPITVHSGSNMIGYGATIKTDQSIKIFVNEHSTNPSPIDRNINIEGFVIDCTDNTTYDQHNNCIYMRGVDNCSIKNVYIINSGSDGIYIGRGLGSGMQKYNNNVLIENVIVNGYQRQGISVVCGDVEINSCHVINSHSVVGHAVDVEPNEQWDNSNVTIKGCFLDGGVSNSSDDGASYNVVNISDCVIHKEDGIAVNGKNEPMHILNCEISNTGANRAVVFYKAEGSEVKNCKITTPNAGIVFSQANFACAEGNVIKAGTIGINALISKDCIIENNKVYGNSAASSIHARADSDRVRVINNIIVGPASASIYFGIYIESSKNSIVSGNIFEGSNNYDRDITSSGTSDYNMYVNNIVNTGKIVINEANSLIDNNLTI